MKVLVTGGAGYIGCHTCLELILSGYQVVVVDNLCNSSLESLKRVEEITNSKIDFYQIDIRDENSLINVFNQHSIDAVIHFAGLKAVSESVDQPQIYYDVNVCGTLCLARVMQRFESKTLIFSSSATVYGEPESHPVRENSPLIANNPYGRSKLVVEEFLRDLFAADNSWRIAILRYFNPAGAHKSGMIGEDPKNIPTNLVPYISQVAAGKLSVLEVFGGDYNTRDGTGIRDYIHVVDLALGHIKALEALNKLADIITLNLGTGEGYSVLEMIQAFSQASNKNIPYRIVSRRQGDIATSYADVTAAENKIGWKSDRTLTEMCEDTWRWQKKNPNGYS
jgi:UDP-glucose 4-epimerase